MKSSIISLSTIIPFAIGQSLAFDPREATIDSVHHSLYTGLATCRDVVSSFLVRIQALNNNTNAILTLNPNALSTADSLDLALAGGNATGSLFCIPVLLKDNYDTFDMPTSGGCLALKNSQPTVDAPTVTALRKAGAIILGKANLHELALEGLSVSSLGGQTVNPYDHTRTPGGSSGGSAAALAASFAVIATGTDTVNSLRNPASANSLFSIRPTRGLLSRAGVQPISWTQDNVGAFGRTVRDVAVALTVMASVGYDPMDNVTSTRPAEVKGIDYASELHESGSTTNLKGVRLGVVTSFFNRSTGNETVPVNRAVDETIARLRDAGATIVSVNESIYNSTSISKLDVQRYEYRESMTEYLQKSLLSGPHPKTLSDLYHSTNGSFLVIPTEYEYVTTSLASSTSNATYETVQAGIRNLTLTLQATFARNNLDALIYPQQTNLVVKVGSPSQAGRNGILAALTGFPVVTVPAGFSNASTDAPIGVPIGMEILGRPWDDEKLLKIGAKIEALKRVRKTPVWARQVVEWGNLSSIPILSPNNHNIPAAYPVGVI